MPTQIDITGRHFGRLIALEAVDAERWRFRCDCGNETVAYKHNVIRGFTRSCGCLRKDASAIRNATHGHTRGPTKSKTYAAWGSMLERCHNPRNKQFRDWGGRGIEVCERWHTFQNFLTDMGECPPGLTVDRIDNEGNYEPGNCRWATRTEQNRHKRTTKLTAKQAALIRQDSRPVSEIVKAFAVSRSLVYQIKSGRIWR